MWPLVAHTADWWEGNPPYKIAHEKICSWCQLLVLQRTLLVSHSGQNRGLGTSHAFGVKEIQIFTYWFNLFQELCFSAIACSVNASLTSTEASPKHSPWFGMGMNSHCGLEVSENDSSGGTVTYGANRERKRRHSVFVVKFTNYRHWLSLAMCAPVTAGDTCLCMITLILKEFNLVNFSICPWWLWCPIYLRLIQSSPYDISKLWKRWRILEASFNTD